MGHEKLHKRETVNQHWRRSKDRPAVEALGADSRIGPQSTRAIGESLGAACRCRLKPPLSNDQILV